MVRFSTFVRGLTVLCALAYFVSCNVPWNKLPNNTGDYCPSRDICIWERHVEPVNIPAGWDSCCKGKTCVHENIVSSQYKYTRWKGSCCTDCSCQSTCGHDNTCCFPELDTTTKSYQKNKACLQLSLPEVEPYLAVDFVHYLMVDSNPDDGCIVDVPDIREGEQCGDVPVSFWGTKYPVYSKLKKTIYKNKHCARCHNETDVSVTLASVALHDCRLGDIIDAVSLNKTMNEELTERQCYISFSFPDVELKNVQCYVSVVKTCKSDFNVPSHMTMTNNEIKQACTSGLFSPFLSRISNGVNVYSNVFCAVCNNKFILNPLCPLLIDMSSTKAPMSKFFTILDDDLITADSSASLAKQRQICFLKGNKKVECRRLFCPKEKFLINGVCKYLSHRLYEYPYFLTLRLVPDKDVRIEVESLIDEIAEKNQVVDKQSSWTKKWEIFQLYVKDNTYTSNSTVVEELIVRMRYRAGTIDPLELFDSIQSNLQSQRFTLVVGNTTYTFQQTLADYYMIYIYQGKGPLRSKYSLSGVKSIANQTVLDKIYRDNVYMILSSKYFKRIKSVLFAITHTHFCDLIQLEKDEYTMYSESILYYIFLDTYFGDGQFDLTIDDNGQPVVRICQSESGFRVTSSSSPRSIFYIDLKMAICFVLFSIFNII